MKDDTTVNTTLQGVLPSFDQEELKYSYGELDYHRSQMDAALNEFRMHLKRANYFLSLIETYTTTT